MLSRICYGLKVFWADRAQLRAFTQDSRLQLAKVTDLQPENLSENGILALALDFDGVMAAHGEPAPAPEVVKWLAVFQQQYAPNKIYILSNKPTPQRQAYFQLNFPHITFVVARRKKPYPDGLQQILQAAGIQPAQLLLVDDRLGTGIVAAISCGVQARWITAPRTNIAARPVRESFFILLRWLERIILSAHTTTEE